MANRFRDKKGFKGASFLSPGAWKAQLGDAWFEGAEELYNKGIVEDIDELLAKAVNPEEKQKLFMEAKEVSKPLGEKVKQFFGKAFTKTKEALGGTPEEVKEIPKLPQQQLELLNKLTQLASTGIPQELEFLQKERETPTLERAFGPLGGTVAGGLGGTILSQLASRPSSEFTSGEFGGGRGISGPLLSSLLGSLGGYAAGNYISRQPQVEGSPLNYLRNLLG